MGLVLAKSELVGVFTVFTLTPKSISAPTSSVGQAGMDQDFLEQPQIRKM